MIIVLKKNTNPEEVQKLIADIESCGNIKANTIIGEGQAIAENLSRRYDREALEAVTLGNDTTVYGEEQAAQLKTMHTQYTDLVAQYQTATEEDKAVIAARPFRAYAVERAHHGGRPAVFYGDLERLEVQFA